MSKVKICVICGKPITFLQRYYDRECITNFEDRTYYFYEYGHKGCVDKLRKSKKDDDSNTSNLVYT